MEVASTGAATAPATATESQTQNEGTQNPTSTPAPKEADAKAKPAVKAEDDNEEVHLGSFKGKVPKGLAAEIKNYVRGSQVKMREFAQMQKLAQTDPAAFIKAHGVSAKENPKLAKQVLESMGLDPYDFSEMTLAEKLEQLSLSPEQKRLRELEAFKAEKENEEKTKAEKERADKESKLEAEQSQTIRQELVEAWKDSGLPPHRYFGGMIAAQMLSHQQQNHKREENGLDPLPPLSAKQAAAKVKADFISHVREVLSAMDPQGILGLLGETMTKVREYDIQRVSSQDSKNGTSQKRTGAPVSVQSNTNKKPMSEQEFRTWKENYYKSLKD